jgi:hypothetical protein
MAVIPKHEVTTTRRIKKQPQQAVPAPWTPVTLSRLAGRSLRGLTVSEFCEVAKYILNPLPPRPQVEVSSVEAVGRIATALERIATVLEARPAKQGTA